MADLALNTDSRLAAPLAAHSITEERMPAVGYEGLYEVSSLGNVRGLDRVIIVSRPRRAGGQPYNKIVLGKRLVPNLSRFSGYIAINLNKNGHCVRHSLHVLVCAAFHGPRPAGWVVAHNDGNRFNNAASNLRYATYAENALDKRAHGTGTGGERNGSAKLTESVVRAIKSAPASVADRSLAERHGVSASCIRLIRLGDRWKHVSV